MILSRTSEKVADLFVYDGLVERERSRLFGWRVGFEVVLSSLTWAVLFTDDVAPKMASLRERSAKLSTLRASYIAEWALVFPCLSMIVDRRDNALTGNVIGVKEPV
jgi:hypothetical protein